MQIVNRNLICGLVFCAVAAGQGPGPVVMPTTRYRPGAAPASASPCETFDPVFRFGYANKHEASVAALLAGDDAENIGHSRERALGMFMMSIQRDPSYAPALFNLGVMSAKAERWDDAVKFYREARNLDTANQLGAVIETEIKRVERIVQLESTPDGHRERHFDIQLAELIGKFSDPAITLDNASKLIKVDPSRWEAPAIAGIMQAALGQYDDSAKSLDTASRLASGEWRSKLVTAADLAREEGQYIRLVREGDEAAVKKNYESAAKLYADAWQASPARVQTGMQSAISFLMADEVSLAVQTLSRLRQVGTPEISDKAGVILKELGAISEPAKSAALLSRSGETEQVVDVAERVRASLGDLLTPEMKISVAPNPALLSDNLKFIHVSDDQINNPASDLLLVSSQSLFTTFQGRICATSNTQQPVSTDSVPQAAAPALPASPPDAAPQAAVPGRPAPLPTGHQ
jgi:tetratricopeptide (TPR) repeat protein